MSRRLALKRPLMLLATFLLAAVAFVVIPQGSTSYLSLSAIFVNISFNNIYLGQNISFSTFCPKIACQAPKPPKQLKGKEIELKFS